MLDRSFALGQQGIDMIPLALNLAPADLAFSKVDSPSARLFLGGHAGALPSARPYDQVVRRVERRRKGTEMRCYSPRSRRN